MSVRNRERTGLGTRFLSRWSQRKLKRNGDDAAEHSPDTDPEISLPTQAVEDGFSVDTADDTVPLPSIDSLDEHSDYRGFLSPDVSEELQRRALRKLFGSARFNVRDGLDDYDDDYRSFEPLGDTVTAEMRHRMERELDRKPAVEDTPDNETAFAAATTHDPEPQTAAPQDMDDGHEDSPSPRSG